MVIRTDLHCPGSVLLLIKSSILISVAAENKILKEYFFC